MTKHGWGESESADTQNNSNRKQGSFIDPVDAYSEEQQQALALISRGMLQEAEKIYRDLIAKGVCTHTIYRNLAAISGRQRRLSELVSLLKKAIELNPNHPEDHYDLALSLQQQGNLTSAIDSYQKAVQLKINFPDAHFRLGNALQLEGNLSAAITAYKTAIELKPNFPDAHNNLGVAFQEHGNTTAAIASYKNALRLKPNFLEAHVNCGSALKDKYELTAAIASYEEALRLKPDHAEAHNGMGCALKEKSELTKAITSFKKAIRLKPNYPEAFNNLGNALKDKGDLNAAIASYKTALQLKPNFPDAHYNLGFSLQRQDYLTAAITSYKKAISLKTNFPDAHNNLGSALQQRGDLTSAIASFNNAIMLKPDNEEAYLNLSLAMLLNDNYEKGWELYEWRNKQKGSASTLHALPKCKLWDGRPLKEETKLLLVTEQGLGDTLQFMRYVLALKNQNFIISLCASPRLHPLIKSSGLDPSPLSPKQAEQVKEGQWIPLLSVPRHLNVSPRNPIITEPYIKSTDKLNDKWKYIYSEETKPMIGINWRGNREDASKQYRNIPTHSFRKIIEAYEGNLICLQRGTQYSEMDELLPNHRIKSYQSDISRLADSDDPNNFLEYASVITNCDLVITTGSTVAHMAAGIGVPTWVLLPMVPDWRWGLNGDSTFWYPSMRLFRQRERGNWDELVARVAKALQEHFRVHSVPSEISTADGHAINLYGIKEHNPSEHFLSADTPEDSPEKEITNSSINNIAKEELAIALFDQARFAEAETLLKELISAGTRNPVVYSKLGCLYLSQFRHEKSVPLLKNAIGLNPNAHEFHNYLGIALQHQGDIIGAIGSYKKAIQLNSHFPGAYNNLGNALKDQGNLSSAIKSYQKAVQLKPNFCDAHYNLGITFKEQRDLISAIASLKKSLHLNPNDPEAHNIMGTALREMGNKMEAIASYKTALKLNPNYPEAHCNLGCALYEQGDITSAITSYKRAIQLKPNYPKAYCNLGCALHEQKEFTAAITSYNKAIQLKPNYPEAYNNLGNTYKKKGDLTAAVTSYSRALKLKPNYPEVHSNLGATLQDQGDLTAAITAYNTAIQLNPDQPDVYSNLGKALMEQGDLNAAIISYKKSLELKPDNPDAHLNYSLTMLLLGDYKNGWEGYKWRTKAKGNSSKPHALPSCTQWNGEPLGHETELLLVTEQGLGDILLFMRYALVLRCQNLKVSLCAQTRLHPLIQSSGIDPSPLTPEQANQVKKGRWTPLLSVPRLLEVSPSNPIITKPYIKSSTELTKKWRDIISAKPKPTVGINWRGNRRDTSGQARNIPIHIFRRINETFAGSLLCLQRGTHSSEIDEIICHQKMASHQLDVLRIADSVIPEDFLEYAAIIANCDLVITTGSTVAHLAAGMGIPTWVLLPKVPDWRWGLEGVTTFWYPSMRLFRQRERGNWDEVMERVAEALQEHFGERPSLRKPA